MITELANSIFNEFKNETEDKELDGYEIIKNGYSIFLTGKIYMKVQRWVQTHDDYYEEDGLETSIEDIRLDEVCICYENETEKILTNDELIILEKKIIALW
jgi:hypothetical protein